MINPLIYFLLFIKASLFSSGGFSNLPSLHQDLLANRWASDADFGHSIVIGQVSPGPNGLWVISLGYLSYGVLGASLSLLAITIPPLLVLVIASIYDRLAGKRWVDGLMRGVSLAVVGITITVSWTIFHQAGFDWRSLGIALGAAALSMSKRINILIILGLAGLAGYLFYGI